MAKQEDAEAFLLLNKRKHRNFKRYAEILSILSRHGLGWLILELDLGFLVPFHWGLLGHPKRKEPYNKPEHIRMALEDLGPTFIKIGQILSMRPDILPPEYISQFIKLQDSAPSVSFDKIKKLIEDEFGKPLNKIFKNVDVKPLAVASIAQVHKAILFDGTEVALKIQKPGVELIIEEDLEILSELAHFTKKHSKLAKKVDMDTIVGEFSFIIKNELDYTGEGRNAERMEKNFEGDASLHIPKIFWDYSSKKILTMEIISGIKISDTEALKKKGFDLTDIAKKIAHIYLTMIYKHGFFHMDPHPGNLFVMDNGAIGIIDYGMTGSLDQSLKRALLRLFLSLTEKNVDNVIDEFLTMGVIKRSANLSIIKRDLKHFIKNVYDKPLKDIIAADVFNELMAIAFRHQLEFPSDMIALLRATAIGEGLELILDPEFKLMEFSEPYFKRFFLDSYSFKNQVKRFFEESNGMLEVFYELPKNLKKIFREFDNEGIKTSTEIDGLKDALNEMKRTANRVSVSILTGSLVIGLGLLMLIYHPPVWKAIGGIFFSILFIVVLIFVIGLLWSIWKSGRID